MQLALEWVPAGEHTKQDLIHVLQADEVQPPMAKIALLEIDKALREGKMQLFRFVPGPGVLLTEIVTAFGHKRLNLLRGAGKAGFKTRACFKLMDQTRRDWGCECIETVVYSERLRNLIELAGGRTEGFIMTYSGGDS